MKKLLEKLLGALARVVLKMHKPAIIGITGSVGKSTTKEAVACVLRSKFDVRANAGNLNSQLGLPLTVLGFSHAGGFKKNLTSLMQWVGIVAMSFLRLFQIRYPKILVLEMGTDRPGDIAYLLSITGKLTVAVVTDIGISHLEFFKNPEELAKEKMSLIKGLDKTGSAVLNFDNEKIKSNASKFKGRTISYGFKGAELKASDFQVIRKGEMFGVNFKVHYNGTVVPFFIPHILGEPIVYATLAAAGVGLSFGMNLVEISEALKKLITPPGRLKLLSGIKHTDIIDDTYNAAPSSTIAAIKTLSMVGSGRRLAALGGMAELGEMKDEGHRQVARAIVEYKLDAVFLVGNSCRIIEDELKNKKYPGKINWYETSDQARIPVQDELIPGDTILVKGSQSSRMEKVVKEIMAEPLKAPDLLVRQYSQWLE